MDFLLCTFGFRTKHTQYMPQKNFLSELYFLPLNCVEETGFRREKSIVDQVALIYISVIIVTIF